MRRYVRAVGFCIGLTAVIAFSGINAFFIEGSGKDAESVFGINRATYSLCWLISYLLTAAVVGEFTLNKKIRKLLFLPIIFMTTTCLVFFGFYRINSEAVCLIALALSAVAQGIILFVTIKRTRFLWTGALLNLVWYLIMTGAVTIRTFVK